MKNQMSHGKKHSYFPLCWLFHDGILVMAYYDPQITGWYNPLHTLNNQGFFIAQVVL